MTDLEKVKIYINDTIKNSIEQISGICENSDNAICNVNIGYLKGLAKAIDHVEEVENELRNTEDTSANPYSYEPEEQGKYPGYYIGEAVLYQNGDIFEIGIVKTVILDSEHYPTDEYFVWYNTGDTATRTHARYLHKISNDYAFNIIRLDPEGNERK